MSELTLRIVTPDRTIVDRKVASVTFQGIDGKYGILPRHAPMCTALAHAGAVEVTELDGKHTSIFASDGFAQVQHNVLTIVTEAGEFSYEIDVARAKAAEAKAREKMAHLDRLSEDFIHAEGSLRKALLRETLAQRISGTSV